MSALKAVVPIIANHKKGSMPSFVLFYCYMLDIFFGSNSGGYRCISYFLSSDVGCNGTQLSPPDSITQVKIGIMIKIVTNPVEALLKANYIGILT